MTARKYLQQMWLLDKEIDARLMELEYLKTKAEGCSSPKLTGMPGGKNRKDRIGDIVIRITELNAYIEAKTDELINLREKITKQIDGMPDQMDRVILRRRYMGKTKEDRRWKMIAKDLGYEESTLKKREKDILKRFERRYPEIRRL